MMIRPPPSGPAPAPSASPTSRAIKSNSPNGALSVTAEALWDEPPSGILKPVRVLAALGALCFAYLAIIPGAVVGATVDPACAGAQCSYSAPVTVFTVGVFAAAALALEA